MLDRKGIFTYVLAGIIVLGFVAITVLFMFAKVPQNTERTLFLLVGAWISGFTTIVNYIFGTSKSSANKDSAIAKALEKGTGSGTGPTIKTNS